MTDAQKSEANERMIHKPDTTIHGLTIASDVGWRMTGGESGDNATRLSATLVLRVIGIEDDDTEGRMQENAISLHLEAWRVIDCATHNAMAELDANRNRCDVRGWGICSDVHAEWECLDGDLAELQNRLGSQPHFSTVNIPRFDGEYIVVAFPFSA